MPKRILLVDDEELFLKSLKEGLESHADIFSVDICYSVNEAIKNVALYDYDLIVTDMRMPEKSGLELLLFLKERRYSGKVFVMSAYNNAENTQRIKSLGVIDVISKPFRLDFFKNLLLEHFRVEKEGTVLFETIDLVTVMQVINMEKKTSALEVDVDGKKGVIFFVDGEIVHAEFERLTGEEAVLKLIAQPGGQISVRKIKNKVKRTIHIPFVKHMMTIMQTVDEIRRDRDEIKQESELIKGENPDRDDFNCPTGRIKPEAIESILSSLSDVSGFIAAVVFTPTGEILGGTPKISRFNFEKSGSIIYEILKDAKIMSNNMELGRVDMIQVHSELGVIFAVCLDGDDIRAHLIMIIEPDGNLAMAKIRMYKVVESIKKIL